eukprot:TRINITY_DN18853_c0_g1_i1.p1 TRINITY_DN18853_c0_g1~~TRINITY_DN18853_c0_g1_i1.p1  ORF type:complete len:146 (+),score=49.49 TRINITY_DN18853_c0_g1_i1:90-527(+)
MCIRDRCTEIQTERIRAIAEGNQRLGLSQNALLRTQTKKVEAATVLSVLCNESKNILREKQALTESVASLHSQRNALTQRFEETLEQKHGVQQQLAQSRRNLDDTSERLDDSLKLADCLKQEIADFHGYCNSKSLDFRSELQQLQ